MLNRFARHYWPTAQTGLSLLLMMGLVLGCTVRSTANAPVPPTAPVTLAELDAANEDVWRRMTETEAIAQLQSITRSPLGVAALNELAIEGFISPVCPQTFYVNERYGGFQTLLQVTCPTERGTSIALSYTEVRVLFNRFEDNIESFEVERISAERPPAFPLPTP